jgi:hypothetical protein
MTLLARMDRLVEELCEKMFPADEREPLKPRCCHPEILVPTPAVSRCIVPKLVVFDVDSTLLLPDQPLANMQRLRRLAGVEEEQGRFVDCRFFSQLCAALRSRDHLVGLATFCEAHASFFSMSPHAADVLVAMLDSTLPFCRDYLRDDLYIVCGSPPRRSSAYKNEHLQQLLQRVQSSEGITLERCNVVLIDDCEGNVSAARCAGFTAFCCPQGLSREWFSQAYQLQDVLGLTARDVEAETFESPFSQLQQRRHLCEDTTADV